MPESVPRNLRTTLKTLRRDLEEGKIKILPPEENRRRTLKLLDRAEKFKELIRAEKVRRGMPDNSLN